MEPLADLYVLRAFTSYLETHPGTHGYIGDIWEQILEYYVDVLVAPVPELKGLIKNYIKFGNTPPNTEGYMLKWNCSLTVDKGCVNNGGNNHFKLSASKS